MAERVVGRQLIVGKDRVDRVDLLLRERDVGLQDAFQRFLMRRFRVFAPGRQLRERAAGGRHREQQGENDAEGARALLSGEEDDALLDRRAGEAQRGRLARGLRQNGARVGHTLRR